MAADFPPVSPALPNVAPMTGDQQGMSPSTVVAAAATDLPGAGEDMTGGTKGQGKGGDTVETGVAVRMMAVSMAATPGQSPTAREAQFAQQGASLAMMGDAGPAVGPEGYGTIQNVSQAS